MGQRLLAERIARYELAGLSKQNGALRGHDALPETVRTGMAKHFGVELELWPRDALRAVFGDQSLFRGPLLPRYFPVHPHNLALGLAAAASQQGAKILERSACTGLDLETPTKRVRTATGEVRARTVVIACGGYVGSLLRQLQWATVPIATFVAVTEQLGPELDAAIATRHAISDLQFATNYFRRLDGDRLLWGGRIKAWEPDPERIARDLHRDMTSFYPALAAARFEFVWSGLMSFLRHQMPAIGQLRPDVWYATGFGGLGLALTSMAGRLIGSALTEGDGRWHEFAHFGLPFAGDVLGRVPARMLHWRAEIAGRLGLVTAHD